MNPRERNLLVGFLAVIVLGGGAYGGYNLVYSPLQETNTSIDQLEEEINGKQGLSDRVEAMKKAAAQTAIIKRQSLPPNTDLAKTQYKLLLERLLQQAKIEHYTIPDAKVLDSRAPATPDLGNKKPAFIRLGFKLDMKKTDIWQVTDFLHEFYELDLLHQITDFSVVRENKPTEARNGLDVHLNIEAIILDGAEQKLALFPVTLGSKLTPSGEAVAAIGGGQAAVTVAAKPELLRKITATVNSPVLATHTRDYSLIAQKDIFYGVLPDKQTPRDPRPPTKDDISSEIRLVMVNGSSDGNITALIYDMYSPLKYSITYDPKSGIKVQKTWLAITTPRYRPDNTRPEWRLSSDYKYPEGVLAISDELSSTKRTFKVMAIESDALIVADIDPDAKGGRGRGFGGPPMNHKPIGTANSGPPSPTTQVRMLVNLTMGIVTGNLIKQPMAPPGVVYRWENGKSLKDLDRGRLSPEETRKVLQNFVDKGAVELPVSIAK